MKMIKMFLAISLLSTSVKAAVFMCGSLDYNGHFLYAGQRAVIRPLSEKALDNLLEQKRKILKDRLSEVSICIKGYFVFEDSNATYWQAFEVVPANKTEASITPIK